MPELPEVESLRRLLAASLVGRRIVAAQVAERRLRRPLAENLAHQLTGATIQGVRRRAKYLLLDLSGERILMVHLGMSGSLTHRGHEFDDSHFNPAHDHVRMKLDDGTALVYNDPRRFGLMKLGRAAEIESSTELRLLGPEPLSKHFNPTYLAARARGRKTAIKNLLMDQRVVAGVGNIYASEILFLAGVRPQRRAGRVTRAEFERIVAATARVLSEAIGEGGTTFRSYRDSRGQPGRFMRRLQVYGREGEPCYRCHNKVVSRLVGQRSSFYCATCQR
jgi:formamidopyrimidine-DNA glycosylase